MPDLGTTITAVARINGVALHSPSEAVAAEVLRQRACTELLRQAAQREGLLAATDVPATDDAISEAATAAIDALLERALHVPDPSDEACRRYHAAHAARFAAGERAHIRHILFILSGLLPFPESGPVPVPEEGMSQRSFTFTRIPPGTGFSDTTYR